MSSLFIWSWVFLLAYIGVMFGVGIYASKKVATGDDFAVARGTYGPVVLAVVVAM